MYTGGAQQKSDPACGFGGKKGLLLLGVRDFGGSFQLGVLTHETAFTFCLR